MHPYAPNPLLCGVAFCGAPPSSCCPIPSRACFVMPPTAHHASDKAKADVDDHETKVEPAPGPSPAVIQNNLAKGAKRAKENLIQVRGVHTETV